MRRRISLGFVLVMGLLSLGFALSLLSYSRHNDDSEGAEQAQAVIDRTNTLQLLVQEIETGTRGYILTGENRYLNPRTVSLPQIPGHLDSIYRMAFSHGPGIRFLVGQLRQQIVAKLVVSDKQLKLTHAGQMANRDTLRAYLNIGRERMKAVRQTIATIQTAETERLHRQMAQAERSYRNTQLIIFGLSTLTFFTIIALYRMLRDELHRRQRNEDQLREYEVRLREQIRQLETSNEELERFAYVASHDLQEPLRKIRSFATLITARHGNTLEKESDLYVQKISSSADRMSKLIKDLLDFSRISNHREEPVLVSLDEVVRYVLDDQELRIKGLGAQIEVGRLPTVQAIPGQMDHLFANLISNALKFVRPGVVPRLHIDATLANVGQYPNLADNRTYHEIRVEDNGIGFDEKYLDHIFKVFQRLHGKSAFEGTGIGLAICKRIVMAHEGHITAHSQPGAGTTFILILPERQSRQDYDRSNPIKAHSYSAG
ncbi:histidine kinase [Spirosoma rhododendri]|uniref:histidine kinase n=2 Tax=Spirosoma rhododendri TaxID=2728024 RepID=A0A7L5DZB7_9BACT|nr:histidine kinase [Spirosoma rhododendri]